MNNNKIELQEWDTAEFLKTKEDIDAYLKIAFETSDPKYISKALGIVSRAYGMNNISNETGIAREQLYKSFGSKGNPTLKSLTLLVDALGYKLSITPKTV